ncbi:MDR family oxidoreductase [Glaciihabitans sp. dw_435]|uniref:MDR family oxidoreductase n=1 Tax=Glaciihabitans sp. dw_435 TaxID=2720081 RepID=UPI001BD45414|nr:MDR family oxidoreductase [Glaciihabitans sp. dw_435]
MFRALQVTRDGAGGASAVRVELREDIPDSELGEGPLGDGEVLIDVEWSGINYKDGLALAGNPGVMRTSPLIPGIDLVGTVAAVAGSADASASVRVGDRVLVNGWGIGETHNGGLATRARVRTEWLVPLPPGISARRAAAIGTAGFTAALSVLALERGGLGGGDVLVTGASGGVGSVAIALLAASGHRPIASTGRPEHRDYLLSLGAAGTIARSELAEPGKPLQKQRWAGVIDSVGGTTLANALAQTVYGGTVAACGLVGGSDLPTTVMPFILRGVTLLGINSVEAPRRMRLEAWDRLSWDLDFDLLDSLTTEVSLTDAAGAAARTLAGESRGRTVVNVRA